MRRSPASGAPWTEWHELSRPARVVVVRAGAAAGPALFHPPAAARTDGLEPAPLAAASAGDKSPRALPAVPAGSAADPADAGASHACHRAGAAGHHADGRRR